MPVVPQGIPGKMKTHPVSSQCVGYSRPACTFFFSFLPFLWPFLTLFYDTGFPAASAWWPQLLEPKWHQVFARDDDGLVVVPADFQNTVHLIKVMSPARVESPRLKEMYLQHGESRISCPVDDFLKCSFFSLWCLQGRRDPQQVRHRCRHLPVFPAPRHLAHDCVLPAIFNRDPAGQLFRETPGYFGRFVKV